MQLDLYAPLGPMKPADDSTKNSPVSIVPVPDDAPALVPNGFVADGNRQLPPVYNPHRMKDGKEPWVQYAPVGIWRYDDAEGDLVAYRLRLSVKNTKAYVTCCYAELPDGERAWCAISPPRPRPLYKLPALVAHPESLVLVVEGEKAADAAAILFPDMTATTSMDGAKSPQHSDWTPLTGRHVVVWPDADKVGRSFAQTVAKLVTDTGAASVRVVAVPQDWPDGWDLADPLPAGVTAEQIRTMALQAPTWSPAAVEHAEPPALPGLLVDKGNLVQSAKDMGNILQNRPDLFDRNGPVRVVRDEQRGGLVIKPLETNGLVVIAHEVCQPYVLQPKGDAIVKVPVTLPDRVANLYNALSSECRGLRPLDGLTSAPLLTDDGGIRFTVGYDPTSRLFCEGTSGSLQVHEAPSQSAAEAALGELRRHFRTFPFSDAVVMQDSDLGVPVVDLSVPPGEDESAAIIAMMTATCRPSLPLAPGLMVTAPAYSGSGAGKGKLVKCCCLVAYGSNPRALTIGGSKEEMDKRIAAALIGGDGVLFLDNVNGTDLKSDLLASAITERPAHIRPLGSSTTVTLNSAAFIAVTGNGLRASEDLARRFLYVELDPRTENPETRPFRGDFEVDTLMARPRLLTAALTIWRWGRLNDPDINPGKPFGSFGQWSRWVRDPLVALGCRDPADRVARMKANDPRRREVAEIFATWWKTHRTAEMAAADLDPAVTALIDPMGRGRQFIVGRLRKLEGTRASGFTLVHIPMDGRWTADRYKLVQTEPEKIAGTEGL